MFGCSVVCRWTTPLFLHRSSPKLHTWQSLILWGIKTCQMVSGKTGIYSGWAYHTTLFNMTHTTEKKKTQGKKARKFSLQSVLRHAELMQIVSDAYWLRGKTLQEATFTCLDQQLPYQFPELCKGRIGAALSWLLATSYSRQPYGKSFQMLLKKERYIQSWFSNTSMAAFQHKISTDM